MIGRRLAAFGLVPWILLTSIADGGDAMPMPGPVESSNIPAGSISELQPGQLIQVEWREKWWQAEVKEVYSDEKAFIHYVGWPDTWDEVVPLRRIQLVSKESRSARPRREVRPDSPPVPPGEKRPWGPEQLLGGPDTHEYGDIPSAWASLTPDGHQEWIELRYEGPISADAIFIYETYNPGAITRVTVGDNGGKQVVVWTGEAKPHAEQSRRSIIPVAVDFPVIHVRVELDSRAVPGWNEIDTVGVIDRRGNSHWPVGASASSTYASTQRKQNRSPVPIRQEDLEAAVRRDLETSVRRDVQALREEVQRLERRLDHLERTKTRE